MITIKDYVESLFKDIPDSKEKEDIKNEIILNLEEKVLDLVESGKAEEDAINKSIVEFGDITEIKMNLLSQPGTATVVKKASKINYANRMWFSVWGSLLIIGLCFFINYTTNSWYIHPWFVYPTFAVLWWPLAMFFSWLNHREK
ncbi:MAG: permease prefix domain 1-containing protein [Eubacteriales bacterium]